MISFGCVIVVRGSLADLIEIFAQFVMIRQVGVDGYDIPGMVRCILGGYYLPPIIYILAIFKGEKKL